MYTTISRIEGFKNVRLKHFIIIHEKMVSVINMELLICKRHIKNHSPEYIKQKKLEEIRIETFGHTFHYKCEHTISYSCISDLENKNSRIDLVIEFKDSNDTFGHTFLEINEHQQK